MNMNMGSVRWNVGMLYKILPLNGEKIKKGKKWTEEYFLTAPGVKR
jgi:hypothetical protein